MKAVMSKRLKLVFACGPGNVIGTYAHWKEGREDPSQVARTYSAQFYDVVRELNAEALVISSHPSGETLNDADFLLQHRPIPLSNVGGVRFHAGQLFAAVRLLWKAWSYGADVMIVADGSCHWFPLRIARKLGIKVIPTFFCVLWRKGAPQRRIQRILNYLARPLFSNPDSYILSMSAAITDQLKELAGSKDIRIRQFLPTYFRDQFDASLPPSIRRTPFRVFYAGRIEVNKGVFELLKIAQRFQREGRTEIEFDIAGNGSALDSLKTAVEDSAPPLSNRFRCLGHCDKKRMKELFSAAHVVIVPTTSDFVEGFNQVVAEGVLSGRPVITSSVCPALEYVGSAVVEVPADDTQAYGDAILRLCDDTALYDLKAEGCRSVQQQFYDANLGWAAALKAALKQLGIGNQTNEPSSNAVN